MPINCTEPIVPATRDSFYSLDEQVLGVAFDVENEFGGFLDEEPYQTEISRRCQRGGLDVAREVQIRVSFEDFYKDYFLDLLINQSVIIEMKTVRVLSKAHEAQVLNYLLLTNTHHGSLINLKGSKVQRRFVSSSLTLKERQQFEIIDLNWISASMEFENLKAWMIRLLNDWGVYLDFRLYREALTHFLGRKERIPIHSQGEVIGHQEVHLLSDDFAFAISATKRNRDVMLDHQNRFLNHTDLKGIAWINLSGRQVEFTSILKQ